MTSTNEGKDVKSYQASGQKGKSYYIELYKSLEARLSEGTASERSAHLCEAWLRVHSLCEHSAPSTHPHLLSWLQRHTARTVLQTGWQSPKRKDDRDNLEQAIDCFISESEAALLSRHGVGPPWEEQLVARGHWFKRVLERPWDHPVLNVLLNPNGTPPTDDEVLKWLKEERGVTFVMRLHTLVAEKCDDIAISLASAVMERVRACAPPVDDVGDNEEHKDKLADTNAEPTFSDKLRDEAGFTVDVWEILTDIEFVLTNKRDSSKCISLAKQTPLRGAYQLVERLQSRLETSPREKRLWKNAKEVAVLIAQVVIARCMMVPNCTGVPRTALYCCTRSLTRLTPAPRLPAAAAALAAPAPTARHLHTLAAAVDAQLSASNENLKAFVCELYVRAITAGMNELERLKLKTEKEAEARLMEQTLASWFVQLGCVLSASARMKCECVLTAFSVHPSRALYEQIQAAPQCALIATDTQEPKEENVKSEFGSWANDSRSQTNFVKTSETLNIKQSEQHQANVLSTALLNDGEALGLSAELCQDIAVLLSGPRVKTLSLDMDRNVLLENCRTYIERTHGGTRALTTELKYLNLDLKQFQHLPEEADEDENDIYYGIEKGYEHLVEFQQPDIWEENVNDHSRTESASSEEEEYIRKKKNKKRVPQSSEEDSDPLSLVAEAKRTQKKKERPHSKERSKERAKKKHPPPDPLAIDTEKKEKTEKTKEKKERKKKEKTPKVKPDGSLASLVGLKVGTKSGARKKTAKDAIVSSMTDSDYDSQGKSSLQSLNSEGCDVLYDGLFSMDEFKYPPRRSSQSSDSMGLMRNNEFSIANGRVGLNSASSSQTQRFPKNPNMACRPPTPNSVQVSPSNLKSMSPTYRSVPDDVRASISKLLEFRRRKAMEHNQRFNNTYTTVHSERKPPQTISQSEHKPPHATTQSEHKPLQTTTQSECKPLQTTTQLERKPPNAIMRPDIPIQTNISPKAVVIPEIPKSYINKQHAEKLAKLKKDVALLLAQNRSQEYQKSTLSSPVIQYAKKDNAVASTSMPSPSCSGAQQLMNSIKMKDLISVPQERHVMEKLARQNMGSSIDDNIKSAYYQRPTQPNILHKSRNVETPGQRDFQNFIRQQQFEDSYAIDKSSKMRYKDHAKKEVKPVSRVAPVLPVNKPETKTPQCAKQLPQQKKPDQSLNTFSRLSYMHKNKQNDMKNKATAPEQSNTNQQSISDELDQIIMEHKRAQMKVIQAKHEKAERYIKLAKGHAQNVINKYEAPIANTRGYPMLANLLNQPSTSTSDTRNENVFKNTPVEQKPVSPPKSALSEKDQNDLIHLLRQQSKLNVPQRRIAEVSSFSASTNSNAALPTLTAKAFAMSNYNEMPITKPQQYSQPDIIPRLESNAEYRKATEKKVINIISEDIIKPADTALNMDDHTKPTVIATRKAVKINDVQNKSKKSDAYNSQAKKITAPRPTSEQKKSTEWESVMSAILKHKTPCRGPNALDIALNKSSFEKVFEESFRNPPEISNEYVPDQEKAITPKTVTDLSPAAFMSKYKSITLTKVSDQSNTNDQKVCSNVSEISQTQNNETAKKPNPADSSKKLRHAVQRKQYTYAGPQHDDPFISGIRNSDFDLLEELMDDDLRKEIGELSSDDDSYTSAAQSFLKPTKTNDKRVSVQYNKTTDDKAKKPTITGPSQNVQRASNEILQTNKKQILHCDTKISQGDNVKDASNDVSNKPLDDLKTAISIAPPVTNQIRHNNVTIANTQVAIEPNIFITAVSEQPPVQNVVLIGSEVVYGSYSTVQTSIQSVSNIAANAYVAVNNVPNMTLYQTTQYAAPVINPMIIRSAVAVPIISNVPCATISVQNINPTIGNVPQLAYTVSSDEQEAHVTYTQKDKQIKVSCENNDSTAKSDAHDTHSRKDIQQSNVSTVPNTYVTVSEKDVQQSNAETVEPHQRVTYSQKNIQQSNAETVEPHQRVTYSQKNIQQSNALFEPHKHDTCSEKDTQQSDAATAEPHKHVTSQKDTYQSKSNVSTVPNTYVTVSERDVQQSNAEKVEPHNRDTCSQTNIQQSNAALFEPHKHDTCSKKNQKSNAATAEPHKHVTSQKDTYQSKSNVSTVPNTYVTVSEKDVQQSNAEKVEPHNRDTCSQTNIQQSNAALFEPHKHDTCSKKYIQKSNAATAEPHKRVNCSQKDTYQSIDNAPLVDEQTPVDDGPIINNFNILQENNNFEFGTRLSERKVLSEVQEKLTVAEKIDISRKIQKAEYDRSTKKDTSADLERLKKKRLAIINRQVHHRCGDKPIPLTYSPLPPKPNPLIYALIKRADDEPRVKTSDSVSVAIKEVASSTTSDNCKENKSDLKPCRRILLRSSNKLKVKTDSVKVVPETSISKKSKAKLKHTPTPVPTAEEDVTSSAKTSKDQEGNTEKRASKRIRDKAMVKVKVNEEKQKKHNNKNTNKLDVTAEKSVVNQDSVNRDDVNKMTNEMEFVDIEAALLGSKIPKVSKRATRKTSCKVGNIAIKEADELSNNKTSITMMAVVNTDFAKSEFKDEISSRNSTKNQVSVGIIKEKAINNNITDNLHESTAIKNVSSREIQDKAQITAENINKIDKEVKIIQNRDNTECVPNQQNEILGQITPDCSTNSDVDIKIFDTPPVSALANVITEKLEQTVIKETITYRRTSLGSISEPSPAIPTCVYESKDKKEVISAESVIAPDNKKLVESVTAKTKINQKASREIDISAITETSASTDEIHVLNVLEQANVVQKYDQQSSYGLKNIETSSKTQESHSCISDAKPSKIDDEIVLIEDTANPSKAATGDIKKPPKKTAAYSELHVKDNQKQNDKNSAPNFSDLSEIPQSYRDSIIIEHLPPKKNEDPMKKSVRIILPHGRSFKATVYGDVYVNFDSLFADPAIKSLLLNSLKCKTRYTMNIKQVTTMARDDPTKIMSTQIQEVKTFAQPDPTETINLLSDDEDDTSPPPPSLPPPRPLSPPAQAFNTEFGKYKILSMDEDLYAKHQNLLRQKCKVLLKKYIEPSNDQHPTLQKPTRDDSGLDCISPIIPVKYVAGIICDIEKKICHENKVVLPEVVEIDDSSNDSVDILSSSKHLVKPPEETMSVLKNELLRDLGVEDLLCTEPLKETSTESNDSSELEIINLVEDVCTPQVISIVDPKKQEQLEIINRKCYIQLVRCDELVEQLSKSVMNIDEDKENPENVKEKRDVTEEDALSDTDSIPILADFVMLDDPDSNVVESENDRNSPVIEFFDILASLDTKLIHNIPTERPISSLCCEANWFSTKRMTHSISVNCDKFINYKIMDQSNQFCKANKFAKRSDQPMCVNYDEPELQNKEISKASRSCAWDFIQNDAVSPKMYAMPRLTTLALEFIQDSYLIDQYKHIRDLRHASPVTLLKRKSTSKETISSPKVSKLDNVDIVNKPNIMNCCFSSTITLDSSSSTLDEDSNMTPIPEITDGSADKPFDNTKCLNKSNETHESSDTDVSNTSVSILNVSEELQITDIHVELRDTTRIENEISAAGDCSATDYIETTKHDDDLMAKESEVTENLVERPDTTKRPDEINGTSNFSAADVGPNIKVPVDDSSNTQEHELTASSVNELSYNNRSQNGTNFMSYCSTSAITNSITPLVDFPLTQEPEITDALVDKTLDVPERQHEENLMMLVPELPDTAVEEAPDSPVIDITNTEIPGEDITLIEEPEIIDAPMKGSSDTAESEYDTNFAFCSTTDITNTAVQNCTDDIPMIEVFNAMEELSDTEKSECDTHNAYTSSTVVMKEPKIIDVSIERASDTVKREYDANITLRSSTTDITNIANSSDGITLIKEPEIVDDPMDESFVTSKSEYDMNIVSGSLTTDIINTGNPTDGVPVIEKPKLSDDSVKKSSDSCATAITNTTNSTVDFPLTQESYLVNASVEKSPDMENVCDKYIALDLLSINITNTIYAVDDILLTKEPEITDAPVEKVPNTGERYTNSAPGSSATNITDTTDSTIDIPLSQESDLVNASVERSPDTERVYDAHIIPDMSVAEKIYAKEDISLTKQPEITDAALKEVPDTEKRDTNIAPDHITNTINPTEDSPLIKEPELTDAPMEESSHIAKSKDDKNITTDATATYATSYINTILDSPLTKKPKINDSPLEEVADKVERADTHSAHDASTSNISDTINRTENMLLVEELESTDASMEDSPDNTKSAYDRNIVTGSSATNVINLNNSTLDFPLSKKPELSDSSLEEIPDMAERNDTNIAPDSCPTVITSTINPAADMSSIEEQELKIASKEEAPSTTKSEYNTVSESFPTHITNLVNLKDFIKKQKTYSPVEEIPDEAEKDNANIADSAKKIDPTENYPLKQKPEITSIPVDESLGVVETQIVSDSFSTDITKLTNPTQDSTLTKEPVITYSPLEEIPDTPETEDANIADSAKIIDPTEDIPLIREPEITGTPLDEPLRVGETQIVSDTFATDITKLINPTEDFTLTKEPEITDEAEKDDANITDSAKKINTTEDIPLKQEPQITSIPVDESLEVVEAQIVSDSFSADISKLINPTQDCTLTKEPEITDASLEEIPNTLETEDATIADSARIIDPTEDIPLIRESDITGFPVDESLGVMETQIVSDSFATDITKLINPTEDFTLTKEPEITDEAEKDDANIADSAKKIDPTENNPLKQELEITSIPVDELLEVVETQIGSDSFSTDITKLTNPTQDCTLTKEPEITYASLEENTAETEDPNIADSSRITDPTEDIPLIRESDITGFPVDESLGVMETQIVSDSFATDITKFINPTEDVTLTKEPEITDAPVEEICDTVEIDDTNIAPDSYITNLINTTKDITLNQEHERTVVSGNESLVVGTQNETNVTHDSLAVDDTVETEDRNIPPDSCAADITYLINPTKNVTLDQEHARTVVSGNESLVAETLNETNATNDYFAADTIAVPILEVDDNVIIQQPQIIKSSVDVSPTGTNKNETLSTIIDQVPKLSCTEQHETNNSNGQRSALNADSMGIPSLALEVDMNVDDDIMIPSEIQTDMDVICVASQNATDTKQETISIIQAIDTVLCTLPPVEQDGNHEEVTDKSAYDNFKLAQNSVGSLEPIKPDNSNVGAAENSVSLNVTLQEKFCESAIVLQDQNCEVSLPSAVETDNTESCKTDVTSQESNFSVIQICEKNGNGLSDSHVVDTSEEISKDRDMEYCLKNNILMEETKNTVVTANIKDTSECQKNHKNDASDFSEENKISNKEKIDKEPVLANNENIDAEIKGECRIEDVIEANIYQQKCDGISVTEEIIALENENIAEKETPELDTTDSNRAEISNTSLFLNEEIKEDDDVLIVTENGMFVLEGKSTEDDKMIDLHSGVTRDDITLVNSERKTFGYEKEIVNQDNKNKSIIISDVSDCDLKQNLENDNKSEKQSDIFEQEDEGQNSSEESEAKWEISIKNSDNEEEALFTSSDVSAETIVSKYVKMMRKEDSEVVLKCIEYEDPEAGTCYVIPIVESSEIDDESSSLDGLNSHEVIECIKGVSEDNIDLTKAADIENQESFELLVPKQTYAKSYTTERPRRGLKRKMDMSDMRCPEKKYRKGKHIDYPKITAAVIAENAYGKEYKRLFEYITSIKFSYSLPFHKEYIDVDDMHTRWPVIDNHGELSQASIESNETLFIDLEDKENPKVVPDPMKQTLPEEISSEYNETNYTPSTIDETNFNMGFGERSGRVIQDLKDGVDTTLSAATLSDVKPLQPYLPSEEEGCLNNQNSICLDEDQRVKMLRFIDRLNLKERVRSYFKKTSTELSYDWIKDSKKNDYDETLSSFPFGLTSPNFIRPSTVESVVHVVQVGQLPASAAAQNPVTCDPRVTHVSNVSPSQCSPDNHPSDDIQTTIKTEYTELTTADITLPLMQEYAQRHHPMSAESQEANNFPVSDGDIPVSTETTIVKIELMEETSEDKMENDDYESNELSNHVNNDVQYNFDNAINNSPKSDQNHKDGVTPREEIKLTDVYTEQKHHNETSDKTDQIAHAMNAAGITASTESTTTTNADALVDIVSQNAQSEVIVSSQAPTSNYAKASPIAAMALQQALAQILPPPLNQTNMSENNQQTSTNPPVLHFVQGNNAQSVISKPNGTSLLHIVQNKTAATPNGTPTSQHNSFGGLSLVDAGLQQNGNQLLHIVNTGNQKNNNAGQILKRVNLLTNLANVHGSNEQKMVQFVCKSADGKSIQLNAPHQRSMVLRLQPLDPSNIQTNTAKPNEAQDLSPTNNTVNTVNGKESLPVPQEVKSRSTYEENYAKFIQTASPKPVSEKATSLPKFNQVFGKQVYQDNQNEIESNNISENNECPPEENNVHLEQMGEVGNPLLRKQIQTSQAPQPNLVQQIKQTIAPMNIQTMHGGVIYTRQIPVNLGGQTINLITVPSTELVDDAAQKQNDGKFGNQDGESPIIKIVPANQSAANTNGSTEENNAQTGQANDANSNPQPQQQPQPVLTQMRIKLPMLSKAPQMVGGARVVRPSFFQIQRNVIGGANQQVYQQLVLTAAPSLGQSIRLPAQAQAQTNRQTKPPSETQSSPEAQMSSSTLEQLREFDMVLEQVKERSTVQPGTSASGNFSKLNSSPDTTDSATPTTPASESQPQVLYSVGNTQPLNMVNYLNRKSAITCTTPSSHVRSPDSTGTIESPSSSTHAHLPHTMTTSASCASEAAASVPPKPKKKKSKPSVSTANALKLHTAPPKTSTQKPLEDEQTTQRILYILAEYKEQVENSPDKDKPAPRRRNNPAATTSGTSKRKKSSSGSRRRDMSPVLGEDSCRTMGSEDSSCGTSLGECNDCLESHSPEESPPKVVRQLSFEQETTPLTQTRTVPQRNVIVADGQAFAVARGPTGKPATTVLMPANYLLPVSMVKGGQQIAIVTNRGPKLLVGTGEGGTGGTLLLQRLIGPGLKPVLTRPGVRHIRLPTAALHNLQAFNIAQPTPAAQPPDSTASPAPAPTPPDLVDTRAMSSPWPDREAQDVKPERGSSPEGSEPWNLPSSSIADDYGYEEIVRTDNIDRTVLDAIPDRYSPDMEAQRIFDKMFDADSKKSMYDSRCGYDIDASDDDKPYHQVVQRKDGRHHRLTHVSAAALRHKYAILEHELRLQKSLSEECEDLGVDSPSASELFPEAELLFAPSPAHEQTIDQCHTPQPTIHSQGIPQPDLDDQIATDQLLSHNRDELDINLDDVGEIVTVGEDGMTTIQLDHEEFARSHPNTTFHTEPEDGEIPPFTIAQGIKGRQITFHSNRGPGTVVMAPQTTVISQATIEASGTQNAVKFSDINNMINVMPHQVAQNNSMPSVLVNKDDGLTRFDNLLTDNRELHLSNTASAIVHSSGNGTQVIRRVHYDRRDGRFLMDDRDAIMGDDAKMMPDDSRESIGDGSSPDRHPELFWESNSERSEGRRRMDFSSDSDKFCKSPYDEANSTDSSGVGSHTRLDSVIKAAHPERRGSDGSAVEDHNPPLRTYPPKRAQNYIHHTDVERSLTGKTRAGERCHDEGRRRASNRGVVKRGCHCCSGSPAPPKPKKSRTKKPDFPNN